MLCSESRWPQISFVFEVQIDSYMQSFEVVHNNNNNVEKNAILKKHASYS